MSSFLALLTTGHNFELAAGDAGVVLVLVPTAVVTATLLGNLAPALTVVFPRRCWLDRLLFYDALVRQLLPPDKLLGKVAAIHGRAVGVDRVGQNGSVKREAQKVGCKSVDWWGNCM